MLQSLDDTLTFPHAGAGSQGDGVAPLSRPDGGVGLVGIGPGGAAVNEDLELPRDICPVGGGYADNDIGPVIQGQNGAHIVLLNALCRGMAASAPFAETHMEIVDTDAFDLISAFQMGGNDLDDPGGGAGSDGAAVHDQSIHWLTSSKVYCADYSTGVDSLSIKKSGEGRALLFWEPSCDTLTIIRKNREERTWTTSCKSTQ